MISDNKIQLLMLRRVCLKRITYLDECLLMGWYRDLTECVRIQQQLVCWKRKLKNLDSQMEELNNGNETKHD